MAEKLLDVQDVFGFVVFDRGFSVAECVYAVFFYLLFFMVMAASVMVVVAASTVTMIMSVGNGEG